MFKLKLLIHCGNNVGTNRSGDLIVTTGNPQRKQIQNGLKTEVTHRTKIITRIKKEETLLSLLCHTRIDLYFRFNSQCQLLARKKYLISLLSSDKQ